MLKKYSLLVLAALAVASITGCATTAKSTNYSAYKQSRPRSIIVLPPVNESPDVKATYSFYSQVTQPLAESGYYVFPVALVSETFKQNGLDNAADIHTTSPQKIHEIFGADAALYINITKYGATYTILNSVAVVSAKANLVDLKTGETLWSGMATASNDEGGNQNAGGLVGALVSAVVKQIINSVADTSHPVAGVTSYRLLMAQPNGLLHGPYSSQFGKD